MDQFDKVLIYITDSNRVFVSDHQGNLLYLANEQGSFKKDDKKVKDITELLQIEVETVRDSQYLKETTKYDLAHRFWVLTEDYVKIHKKRMLSVKNSWDRVKDRQLKLREYLDSGQEVPKEVREKLKRNIPGKRLSQLQDLLITQNQRHPIEETYPADYQI